MYNSLDSDNDNRSISTAFDATWQKRGHQSLNGVASATCIETRKVLVVVVLTKYCDSLDKENRESSRISNYKGSSGRVETAGVLEIFHRLFAKYNLMYELFWDGDFSAYIAVVEAKSYGHIEILKNSIVSIMLLKG